MQIVIEGAQKLGPDELEMLDGFFQTPLWKSLEKLAGNSVNLMAHQMIDAKDREEVLRLQSSIKALQGFFRSAPLIVHQTVGQKKKVQPKTEAKPASSRRSPPPTATTPT